MELGGGSGVRGEQVPSRLDTLQARAFESVIRLVSRSTKGGWRSRLEGAVHVGEVAGSSPASPTHIPRTSNALLKLDLMVQPQSVSTNWRWSETMNRTTPEDLNETRKHS